MCHVNNYKVMLIAFICVINKLFLFNMTLVHYTLSRSKFSPMSLCNQCIAAHACSLGKTVF